MFPLTYILNLSCVKEYPFKTYTE